MNINLIKLIYAILSLFLLSFLFSIFTRYYLSISINYNIQFNILILYTESIFYIYSYNIMMKYNLFTLLFSCYYKIFYQLNLRERHTSMRN